MTCTEIYLQKRIVGLKMMLHLFPLVLVLLLFYDCVTTMSMYINVFLLVTCGIYLISK